MHVLNTMNQIGKIFELTKSYMLDGIQYALGDLQADAVPSSKAKVEVVLAPDKPE